MIWGLKYIHHHDPFTRWGVYALICLMAIILIRQAFVLLGLSRHAADQQALDTYSRNVSGAFGQARLAREDDAFIQKMARSTGGLFLGALGRTMLFFDPFARGNGHMLTYAPSRTGKTTSVVIAALLHWFFGSVVVTDVKGELSAITARIRALFGHRIIQLDPFGVRKSKSASFNPLRALIDDILHNRGANLEDLALKIASQLASVVDTQKAKDPFFRDNAHNMLIALMLYLAAFDPARCHLPQLRKLVWSTSDGLSDIASQLQGVDWFGGLLKEYGNALADLLLPQYVKTFGPSRDIARKSLRIFSSHSKFGRSCMENDFDPKSVLDGKTTLYIILPDKHLASHGVWMGLIVTLLIEAIMERPRPVPTLMLLEEMGHLGKLPDLDKMLSLLPGKGVRLWMIFQSRQQPLRIYGPEIAKEIEEQSSMKQQWFVRSGEDRKEWSAAIGTTTQKTYTLNHDPRGPQTPWKLSVSEKGVPVIPADAIRTLPEDLQLIEINNHPVVLAQKVPYYQVEPWRSKADPNPSHPEGYPKDRPVLYRVGP
jgi:type IV secretion system protein VirD4